MIATSIYNGRMEIRWWVNVGIMGMMGDSGRLWWVVGSVVHGRAWAGSGQGST